MARTENGVLEIYLIHWLPVVVKNELPFRFVKYEQLRDIVDYYNPLVKPIFRNALKNEIFNLYNAEKAKAMNLLEINNSRVAYYRHAN